MASVINICNIALSRLGIDQAISDLEDTANPRSRACNLHYAECRDRALAELCAGFALFTTPLALIDATAPAGWAYQYQYPSNALSVLALTDENGLRQSSPSSSATFTDATSTWSGGYLRNAVAFEVQAHQTIDSRIIVSDQEDAYAVCIKRITDPNQMTAEFRSALAFLLASEIALILRANPALAQQAGQQYQIALSRSMAQTQNERQPDPPLPSPSIQVRA